MRPEFRKDSFASFFAMATSNFHPYEWQLQVALDGFPDVLPIPTGLGKTEVALAWAWRLLVDEKPEPLHLVVCLPMRSLVTQTAQRLKACFDVLKTAKPEAYADDTLRREGEILVNATTFRFDGSDLMPGKIGAGAFWTGMIDLAGGKAPDAVAGDIQKAWDGLK